MAVYVIADTHFNHKNILKVRPRFATVEEHDTTIVHNILKTCGKRDSLYILGDVCLGPQSFDYLRQIAEGVEFLHIVLGNHDGERSVAPSVEQLMSLCKGVYGMKKYKRAWFTHCPMHPEELRGKINIHGHMHDKVIDDPRYVCVSCEQVDYTPINVETIFRDTAQLLNA